MPEALYRRIDQLEWETLRDAKPEVRALAEKGIAAGARRARPMNGQMGFHSVGTERLRFIVVRAEDAGTTLV